MRKYFFVLFFISTLSVYCQNNIDAGFLPKVILSKKINHITKWVNSLESRTFFYDDSYHLKYSLVDISSILSLKTNFNQSFNFGYILRFRDSETIHRTFQHYNFVHQFSYLKMGHRFAFEQFYQVKKNTFFRTRYRISLEKSLSGENVDKNEFYLKIGNEYLYDFNEIEIRLTPYLGYKLSDEDKVEFGVDYRLSEIENNLPNHDLWFRVTWYYTLN
jgi:hypothetical protein